MFVVLCFWAECFYRKGRGGRKVSYQGCLLFLPLYIAARNKPDFISGQQCYICITQKLDSC